jgi:hypothetical protein
MEVILYPALACLLAEKERSKSFVYIAHAGHKKPKLYLSYMHIALSEVSLGVGGVANY